MQPGLARLHGRAAPTPMASGSRHWREKVAVLAAYAPQALRSVPGFDAAPALAAIAAEAGGGEIAEAEPSPGTAVDPALAAVDAALVDDGARAAARVALAFEEDFAVVDGASGTVPWLAVCLPSRWAPEEKVGRAFAAIHAPVADGDRIVAASEALVRLATSGERFERFVWTISADPHLHQHPARGATPWPDDAEAGADAIAAFASFRHERQRFFPVPGTGQAVFTIRVDSEPLTRAVRSAGDAQRLHEALATMTPAVLAYKGLTPVRDRLLAWLAMRARDGPARERVSA